MSADDSFKPDKIIKAKKGESRWKVAANERTRIMLPHFIDRVRWEGVGWPRVIAPGATVTVIADCVNFGQGSGVDITVSDSEGNFEETVHNTVYGYDTKLQFRVPNEARGVLMVKVSIPKSDRPDWDAGLEEGDLEQMAPAIKIVPSLLQQAKFGKEEVMEGDDVSMTVQTSRDKDRYRGRFEVGRRENYGGKDIFIRHAGPFYKCPEKAGGYEVKWNVTTPMIDRGQIMAQWQIDEAKAQAEENGETYSGPDAYCGIELVARAKHLGLQTDSTEASSSGPDWTGTLTVKDDVSIRLTDLATGAAIPNVDVTILLPDGTEETQTLDDDGTVRLENVAPGPIAYFFPDLPGSSRENPVIGATGQENSTSLWRIHPRQENLLINEDNLSVSDTQAGDITPGTWIYIFPEHIDEIQFPIEAQVQDDGSLKLVDGSDASIWEDDERPADQDAPSTQDGTAYLPLLGTGDLRHVHVMLSAVQLTSRRIEAYMSGNDPYNIAEGPLIRERCFTVSEDEIESSKAESNILLGYAYADVENEVLDVSVPHPTQWAETAHRSYRKAIVQADADRASTSMVEMHASLTMLAAQGFEENAEQSWLEQKARSIESFLGDDATVWDFLNKPKLKQTLTNIRERHQKNTNRIEDAGELLYSTVLTHLHVKHARFDAAKVQKEEIESLNDEALDSFLDVLATESSYIEHASRSTAGRQYLNAVIGSYTAAAPEDGLSEDGAPTFYHVYAYGINTGRAIASVLADKVFEDKRLERLVKQGEYLEEARVIEAKAATVYHNLTQAAASTGVDIRAVDRSVAAQAQTVSRLQAVDRLVSCLADKLRSTVSPPPNYVQAGVDTGPATRLLQRLRRNAWTISHFVTQEMADGADGWSSNRLNDAETRLQSLEDIRELKNEHNDLKSDERKKRSEAQKAGNTASKNAVKQAWAGKFAVGLSALNIVFLMQAYGNASNNDDQAETHILLASSVLDGIGSIRHISGIGPSTSAYSLLTKIGVFSTAIEAIYSGYMFTESVGKQDTGSATGYAISATASFFLIFATGLGAVGVFAIVILGGVIATLFGDTPLETWFKHCAWAKPEYLDSDRSESERAFILDETDEPDSRMLENDLEGLMRIIAQPAVEVALEANGEPFDITQSASGREIDASNPDRLRITVRPRILEPGQILTTLEEVRLIHGDTAILNLDVPEHPLLSNRLGQTSVSRSEWTFGSDIDESGGIRALHWYISFQALPNFQGVRRRIDSWLDAEADLTLLLRRGMNATSYGFSYRGDVGVRITRNVPGPGGGAVTHKVSGALECKDE